MPYYTVSAEEYAETAGLTHVADLLRVRTGTLVRGPRRAFDLTAARVARIVGIEPHECAVDTLRAAEEAFVNASTKPLSVAKSDF